MRLTLYGVNAQTALQKYKNATDFIGSEREKSSALKGGLTEFFTLAVLLKVSGRF